MHQSLAPVILHSCARHERPSSTGDGLPTPASGRRQAALDDPEQMRVLECSRNTLLVVQLLVHCGDRGDGAESSQPLIRPGEHERQEARHEPAFSDWWVPSLTRMSTLYRSGRDRSRRTRSERPVGHRRPGWVSFGFGLSSDASVTRPAAPRTRRDASRQGGLVCVLTDECCHGAVWDGGSELYEDVVV